MSEIVKSVDLAGGRRFLLVEGDLLQEPVDAIVNAANGHLTHGGGVAGVIARAAGHALVGASDAYVASHGPVAPGDAVVTTAGDLPFEGVIHAVGPRQGDGDEEAKLASAIAAALLRGHEQGWRSLAFPAVSSGIFAVPLETCARAYVGGVRRHYDECPDSSLEEVRACLLPGPLVELVEREMEAAG